MLTNAAMLVCLRTLLCQRAYVVCKIDVPTKTVSSTYVRTLKPQCSYVPKELKRPPFSQLLVTMVVLRRGAFKTEVALCMWWLGLSTEFIPKYLKRLKQLSLESLHGVCVWYTLPHRRCDTDEKWKLWTVLLFLYLKMNEKSFWQQYILFIHNLNLKWTES